MVRLSVHSPSFKPAQSSRSSDPATVAPAGNLGRRSRATARRLPTVTSGLRNDDDELRSDEKCPLPAQTHIHTCARGLIPHTHNIFGQIKNPAPMNTLTQAAMTV